MPRFTEHTARLAAEQISEGKALSEIEETELSSLIALCEAELRERDQNRVHWTKNQKRGIYEYRF
jgi:hypothetical protein